MKNPMEYLIQTYQYIESYLAMHGIAPTEREIGQEFNLTPTGAHYRKRRMIKLGWLKSSGIRAIVLKGMPPGSVD